MELTFVSIAVMAVLGVCRHAGGYWAWSLVPPVLAAAAVLPTLVGGRDVAGLGLRVRPLAARSKCEIRNSIAVSAGAMLVLGFVSLALFKYMATHPPLAASIPKERWPSWVLFQFVCVAFPEELFFRGYFLSNSLYLLKTAARMNSSAAGPVSVVLSAGVFALAHLLVLGGPISALTFFPGLFLAGCSLEWAR